MPISEKKATGSFFTPIDLARVLTRWAIRSPLDRVLEPSCGEGIFLLAAIERLRELKATPAQVYETLWAVETNPRPILPSSETGDLDVSQWFGKLLLSDFFEVPAPGSDLFPGTEFPTFDVVLGNPPYVRYQLFSGALRERALARARENGVVLPKLASMWAPFLVHAAAFVGPKGRLAMVLPAELIQVKYAEAIRVFLLRQFARVCIIKFEKKVFPGALEEVVLLLADRQSSNPGLHLAQVRDITDLHDRFQEVVQGPGQAVADASEKWSTYLLDRRAYRAFQSFAGSDLFRPLREDASVDVGVVTGANGYFFLSPSEAEAHGIGPQHLKPAVAKAAHVAGCFFDASAWARLKQRDDKCQILLIDGSAVSADKALQEYVQHGERLGVHQRYKCRIRSPWFALKRLPVADAFLSYMANDVPRLVYNEAKALNSNTIHSVRFRSHEDSLIKAQVVSFYNSVTLLSCELFARSYGGGVLKIEPTEAEGLLLPRLANGELIEQLSNLFTEIDPLIRDGKAEKAIARIDSLVLKKVFRATSSRVATVARSLQDLRSRRLARATE